MTAIYQYIICICLYLYIDILGYGILCTIPTGFDIKSNLSISFEAVNLMPKSFLCEDLTNILNVPDPL